MSFCAHRGKHAVDSSGRGEKSKLLIVQGGPGSGVVQGPAPEGVGGTLALCTGMGDLGDVLVGS